MNVKILKHYLRFCERHDLEPCFTGLKEFHLLTKPVCIFHKKIYTSEYYYY